MSISKDEFIRRAKKICDRWYFTYDADGNLLLMEKPYIIKPGWDKPYVVIWYGPQCVFNEAKIRNLQLIHMVRVRGEQKKVMDDMTGRNKMREQASLSKFKDANRSLFQNAIGVFRREAHDLGFGEHSLQNRMKGLSPSEAKKVIHKTYDYAEKAAAGAASAQHPGVIFDLETRKQERGIS